MIELLKVISNKSSYEKYIKYISQCITSDEYTTILKDIEEYYKIEEEIDWTKFAAWFKLVRHPTINKEKAEIYDDIFSKAEACTLSKTTETIVAEFNTKEYAAQIADNALTIAESGGRLDRVGELFTEWEKEYQLINSPTSIEGVTDLDELVISLTTTPADGIEWHLECLNVSLGPIFKGTFGVVGGAVETGKTTFLTGLCATALKQLPDDKDVVYFLNEEGDHGVTIRVAVALLNAKVDDIKKNPSHYTSDWNKYKHRFKIVHKPGMTKHDIESYLKNYTPGLIVVDQLWKVGGFGGKKTNTTDAMQMAFQWGRELSKQYAPTVATHQADGTAQHEKWISLDQLYYSKVGVQGELDYAILIGKSDDPSEAHERYINIPKNKLPGGARSDAKERHGKWIVEFDSLYPKYECNNF